MNFISNQNEPGSFLLNNNEKLAEKLAQEVIQKRNQYPSMQAFIPEKFSCETYLNFFKRAVNQLVKGEQMLFGKPLKPKLKLPKSCKKKPETLDEIYKQFTKTFNRFQPYIEKFDEDFPIAERGNIRYARENVYWGGPKFFLLSNENVREDRMFLGIVLERFGFEYLQFTSAKHTDNQEKIFFYLFDRGDAKAFKYASPRLKSDKEFILKILNKALAEKKHLVIFKYVSEELRGDRDVASLAIQNKEIPNLQYASDELKDNKLFVKEAIVYHLESYNYASKRLQEDDEVILTVIEQYIKKIESQRGTYNFFSSDANPYNFSKDALTQLFNFIESHSNNKLAILAVIKHYPLAFTCASEALKNDRDFILEAVSINGQIYTLIAQKFKDDKEIQLRARR